MRRLILRSSKNETLAEDLINIVVAKIFDSLSENVRNKLLLKLANVEYTARDMAHENLGEYASVMETSRDGAITSLVITINHILKDNFGKLPKNVRSKLLRRVKNTTYNIR